MLIYNDSEGPQAPRLLDQYMQSELGLQRVNIPDCLVMNLYEAHQYIAWHNDENPLFDTQSRKVEILSLSLGCDGVFCVQPRPGSHGAKALGLRGKKTEEKIREKNLRTAVLLSHGSAVLMNGCFQTEFHHSTIPSTEWQNHAWAAAARSAKKAPTSKEPHINITCRFIVRHNCPQKTLEVKKAEVPFWPAASKAAAPAAAKDAKTAMLEKKIESLQQTGDHQRVTISSMHNHILKLEEDLNRTMCDADNRKIEMLEDKYKTLLVEKQAVATQLHETEQELHYARAAWTDKHNVILHQCYEMVILKDENEHLKYQASVASASGAPSSASKIKKSKLGKQQNKERILLLTASKGIYGDKYQKDTAQILNRLGNSLLLQTFTDTDPLFKGFVKTGQMHRLLISFKDLQHVFVAALQQKANALAFKNCHIDCFVHAIREVAMWRLTYGVANRDQFIPTKEKSIQHDSLQVRVAAIELRLDFDNGVDRFLLQEPSWNGPDRIQVVRNYVNDLQELLLTEKKNQYKLFEKKEGVALPPLPQSWGKVTSVLQMPCVIWIKVVVDNA